VPSSLNENSIKSINTKDVNGLMMPEGVSVGKIFLPHASYTSTENAVAMGRGAGPGCKPRPPWENKLPQRNQV